MKDYSHVTVLTLVQDEDFVRWVKDPEKDFELNVQWSQWMQQNPEKKEIANEARRLILSVLNERQYHLADVKEQHLWSRIEDSIETPEAEKNTTRLSPVRWYSMAAAISAIAILSVWYFAFRKDIRFTVAGDPAQAEVELLKVSNESNKVHIVLLEDGSTITLQPHSTLEYPEKFSGTRRDVYLQGEAFFEVARDPKKPFSVRTNDLVTQVLGTSFRIRAFDQEKNIVVAVKTGKVSVFQESGRSDDQKSAALLTPNQQIVFSKTESRMVKSLVEEPAVVPQADGKKNFVFRDTPIHEVFATLQEAYGVEILFDQELMSNCYLNASLNGVPFYDQLRLICKGINAEYEILDAHIIITGTGCN